MNYIDKLFEAANEGDDNAKYNLGIIFITGCGFEQNFTEAEYWFKEAEKQGNGLAQNRLAIACGKQLSATQDDWQTFYTISKCAAEKGDALA